MADSTFGPDGTADPAPPPLFPDPLAGLVTADLLAHPVEGVDLPRMPIAEPVAPDPELAESMTAAMSTGTDLAAFPAPRAGSAQRPAPKPPARQVRAVASGTRRPAQRTRAGSTQSAYSRQAATPKRAGKTGAIVMFVLVLLVIVYNLFSDLAGAVAGWFH